ncbi:M23 family metallopeptidase [Paracoccaceae bacterium GXU_MW_L88]
MKHLYHLKIVTTDADVLNWRTIKAKCDAIEAVLNTVQNGRFTVSIEYQKLRPEVNAEGRITHEWFDATLRSKYVDFTVLHMTSKQKEQWGIKTTLRGSRHNDADDTGELYMWADEHTRRGRKFNQFIETILHEVRHELKAGTGEKDDTHDLHGQDGTLREAFADIDMAKYRPIRTLWAKTLRAVLIRIIELFTAILAKKKPQTLTLPVRDFAISQAYGTHNCNWYPTTCRHIGLDFATPVGTPVYAPLDCEVIASGYSESLGNFCHVQYEYNGETFVERWLHLNYIPKLGTYRQSALIAHTGNTGYTTGAHFHMDIWYNEVRLDAITSSNWNALTINPKTHYGIE